MNDTYADMALSDANNNEGLRELVDLISTEANMTVTEDLIQKLTGCLFCFKFFKFHVNNLWKPAIFI